MCLRPALQGGESFVASSGLLHNFVVEEHPEYLPILYKSFPTDWRNEEPPGSPGWYLEPLYSYFGGALSATVRTGRAISAMRFPEVPRLTSEEVSCFTYFDSLPKRPGVALGMQLQTGDLQFLNNFVTVHTQDSFCRRRREPSASTAPATTVDQPARNRPTALPRIRGLAQRLPDLTDAGQRPLRQEEHGLPHGHPEACGGSGLDEATGARPGGSRPGCWPVPAWRLA